MTDHQIVYATTVTTERTQPVTVYHNANTLGEFHVPINEANRITSLLNWLFKQAAEYPINAKNLDQEVLIYAPTYSSIIRLSLTLEGTAAASDAAFILNQAFEAIRQETDPCITVTEEQQRLRRDT